MVFLTIEKWPSDQSQVEDEIFDHWKQYFFFLCVVGACQSEWEWMSAWFTGSWQLQNHDFEFENKMPVGLHENWWKSFWFCFTQTDHNLCLNLCFEQPLTFAIQESKVESPPKWYPRLKFLDTDSDKKALQCTFAIWFVLMWMSKN